MSIERECLGPRFASPTGAIRLIGPDYWSYDSQENVMALDAFIAMHYRQGLSPHRVIFEEVFHSAEVEIYDVYDE